MNKAKLLFAPLFVFTIMLGAVLLPNKAQACIDPDTVITVTTSYNEDFTEVAIVLGNLKFMTEAPNVFCSCALGSYVDFFTNLEYVAFVNTGTTTPYPNMEPWVNTSAADAAWDDTQLAPGDWTGFIAEVINGGLGPEDDVELIIRASAPAGMAVSVVDMDSILSLSYIATDAWNPASETLALDHTGYRNIGIDNSSKDFVLVEDAYFDALDEGILLSTENTLYTQLGFTLQPNPASDWIRLNYELTEAGNVIVQVRDMTGRVIFAENQGRQSSGHYQLDYDLKSVLSARGLFFLEVISDKERGIQKICRL